jgi:hypothetical protein
MTIGFLLKIDLVDQPTNRKEAQIKKRKKKKLV